MNSKDEPGLLLVSFSSVYWGVLDRVSRRVVAGGERPVPPAPPADSRGWQTGVHSPMLALPLAACQSVCMAAATQAGPTPT